MNNNISNHYQSERSVEAIFTREMLVKYLKNLEKCKVLDVGGIPTHMESYAFIMKAFEDLNCEYIISDFRGGKYKGDFININIPEKFDLIMFISSLEHFPQCTEGDLVYRESEDKKGFKKALSLLNDNGKIILTVPFGKQRWQQYHQNYNMDGILSLTEGSSILENYCYKLIDNNWIKWDPLDMDDVIYTDRAFGVGCFVLQKN
jgi:hypothetical protein